MHDWLFANQNSWSGAQDAAGQFRTQALSIGADPARYDACLLDAKTEAAIQKDLQEGTGLGVRGTPAFFLSKLDAQGQASSTKPISGALPYEQFVQVIEELLASP